MSVLEFALDAAQRGFRVFPLLPNSKKPAIEAWPVAATRDEKKIREWFTDKDYNLAILCEGISVADVDARNNGHETLQALMAQHEGLTKTLIAKTATGGLHLIYKAPNERLKSKAHALGQGIDLKTGPGAYIVGAGSTINGKEYTWHKDREIADMPKVFLELALQNGQASEKSESAGERIAPETDEAVRRAEAIVEAFEEPAPGERNHAVFKLAAKLYDLGLERATVRSLISGVSTLESDELDTIARSAGTNRQNTLGQNGHHAEGFTPIAIEAPSGKDESALFEMFDEAADKRKTEGSNPLVKGLLDRGALSVWFGPPKTGKTLVLLWLGLCVNAGIPFAKRKTHRGAVVYIAMEGGGGILKRLDGLRKEHPEISRNAFAVIRRKIDLVHQRKAGVDYIIEACRQVTKKTGLPVELIVVDTVARAMGGADENSSVDMGALIDSFDRIRDATGAHLAAIHHTSKGNPHAARGFGGLLGALDSEFEIQKGSLEAKNMRDNEEGMEWGLILEPVVLGLDEDGDPIETRCIRVVDRKEMPIGLTDQETKVMQVIRSNAGKEKFTPADLREWMKIDLKSSLSGARTSQLLSELKRKSVVEKDQQNQYVVATLKDDLK